MAFLAPARLRRRRLRAAVLAALCAALSTPRAGDAGQAAVGAQTWFCPMHADVIETQAGACRICGMTLVAGNPWDEREYALELETTPEAPDAGAPTQLTFTVRDPDSGRIVEDFATVHDRRYHLFFLSQDLNHFEHIHPEQLPDGRWTITVTPDRPGYYRTYSDFLPAGGTPQVIGRTFATRGYDGDLSASVARLEPDAVLERTVDGMTVRLTPSPERIVAGRTHRLEYHLEADGQPVRDLEPYLAAWGHTLVLSEDALEYIHAHPIEYLPPEPQQLGGPDVTFDARFPRPGRYRIWSQFKRGGVVSTFAFTVEAVEASAE